jgi:hypothetical protein
MAAKDKKYVVVLAHADGWGALNANKIVRHLREKHPDVDVYLVVSQATKNKEGGIATKLGDLKTPRELEETNLLEYFRRIDALYDAVPSLAETERQLNGGALPPGVTAENAANYFFDLGQKHGALYTADFLTFKQLAKRCCADGEVHYTTRGGPLGGEEVAAAIANLEKKHGHGPEVLLSVDTMAILPKTVLDKYDCISAHPGPLDTVKIEGMQGTLRSLVNQVLYDRDGKPLPATHRFGEGFAHIKGTLFMQHPELDKGPPVKAILNYVCPGVCAYRAREDVYDGLTDEMIKLLPTLLDTTSRKRMVEKATRAKEELDRRGGHKRIPELEEGQFATWQGTVTGIVNGAGPWGVEVIQNEIIEPLHFQNQMQRFHPGQQAAFEKDFHEVYGSALDRLKAQKKRHLTDPWALLFSGDPDVVIRQHNPETGDVVREFRNTPPKPPER